MRTVTADDRTARARIRDAAIARFAADGVAATSVRSIAENAGVSPALVIHHFGTKEALRAACDRHVAAVIRERKLAAAEAGPQLDPLAALREHPDEPPLLRYLARTLVDGTAEVAALVDELVADAVEYMAVGVESGMLKPSDHPRERAAVLTVWSLGALVLHEHLDRLLGTDLTGPASGTFRYALPATELLTYGLLPEEIYMRVRDALGALTEAGS